MAKVEISKGSQQPLDWSSLVSFCDDMIVPTAKVVDTLVDNLHLESFRNILLDRYSRMKKLYGKACANDPEWVQDGCSIADTRKHKDVLLGIPQDMFDVGNEMWCGEGGILGRKDVGLDLPTWMELKGSKRTERIMIVASEPKRAIHTAGNLWLSSPWAFHSKDYRDHQINPLLRTILESFIRDRHAIVYLTDCRKIYDADGIAQNSYAAEYKRCLEREIKLFNPTVLIGYGSNVLEVLSLGLGENQQRNFSNKVVNGPYADWYQGVRVLVFAHPSPLNASCHKRIWSKMIEKKVGISRDEALLKYYTEWE